MDRTAGAALRGDRGRDACEKEAKLIDSSDSKCNSVYDSGCIDSGFHSGANLSSEQFVSEEIPSRYGSDSEADLPEKSVDSDSKSYARLDSGVDISEQFSSLNLRSTNDLNEPPSRCQDSSLSNINVPTVESTTTLPLDKISSTPAPWETHYQQNEEGDTNLHIAVSQGFVEIVFALIHMAPDPSLLDIKNDDCLTALHLAVMTNQAGVARRLVAAGASLAPRDRHGNTALHMASAAASADCLKALLDAAPSAPAEQLEQRNYDGMRCVHLAACYGSPSALQFLARSGANINSREDRGGRTVLHLAVELRRGDILKLLLEEGLPYLELDATTYSGLTAYQLAACVDSALAGVLASKGAQSRPFPSDESEDEFSDEDEMYRNYQQLTLNADLINASA